MSQGDQFHQYGYDHYLKAPKKPVNQRSNNRGRRHGMLRNVQNPALASIVLLGAAVLFVSVIVMTYPSNENKIRSIPIVKADLSPVKEMPINAGGMSIPNKKSTILARSDQPSIKDEQKKIENLLARNSGQPLMSKGQAISRAMEKGSMSQVPQGAGETANLFLLRSEESREEKKAIDILSADIGSNRELVADEVESIARVKPAFDVKEPRSEDVLQKIGSAQGDGTDGQSDEFVNKVAIAAMVSKPVRANVPRTVHAAGQSPETIEFVRRVLGKKKAVEQPQNIEPAVGAAVPAKITAGMFFVQLASITDPARAGSEWNKMQGKYVVLSNSKFRIQEASLSNGKFYRIQAGPMSKSSANKICDALKRAKKPGGCIVVK